MRSSIEKALKEMNEMLDEMGRTCIESLNGINEVLKSGDLQIASYVVDNDNKIDRMEWDIQKLCLTILLKEQPFARDLRNVVAAMKIITDLERIGDQATDIAERAMVYSEYSQEELELIREMAKEAKQMVVDSIATIHSCDLSLTKSIIEADEIVDGLYDRLKSRLVISEMDLEKQNNSINVIMIAKYLERIADHATNIAEWVEFSITGVHPSYGN